MMTGNTHPRLANEDVVNLVVPVPEPKVQEKIAAEVARRRDEARRRNEARTLGRSQAPLRGGTARAGTRCGRHRRLGVPRVGASNEQAALSRRRDPTPRWRSTSPAAPASNYNRTAYILCDDCAELASKLFLLTDTPAWSEHTKANLATSSGSVKSLTKSGQSFQAKRLGDHAAADALLTRIEARRDRRNEFFHSTHLLDRNFHARDCVGSLLRPARLR